MLWLQQSCFYVTRHTRNRHITNASRRIRNAWHFYHALRLVFKVECGSFGIALLTT
ncbi:DUF3265 domain-containing protein [Vibrio parahaemolyticus]|uniref:DUF3265 domain-containing protein n=1 Tax=Vibrio alginolyticus TaxID=663 RepID=A0ABX4XF38_VIBAL|nr:DUF3265 domain-containing protein [Vibrio alginolyticus]EGQ9599386.1 DUF3265 domain-containing protein [Vibrio parahaemolyticus]AVF70314.1 DUF3265 domain-containing protein [Vibrio alginolyticus]MBS9871430.1 DUF3265 domain-containing protein [Vibrio alginolyticus]MBS9967668.1 DUF3265 domain-containing protein [Vibrio alginolyticus]MBY7681260.1 DUF3265 domain-containing protein [Vibrio alginolyticus]